MRKFPAFVIILAFFSLPLAAMASTPGGDENVAYSAPQVLNYASVATKVHYPLACREARIDGKVNLLILVDASGTPIQHKVLSSAHPLLTEAVLKRAYELKFKPGKVEGSQSEMWIKVPFTFTLKAKNRK